MTSQENSAGKLRKISTQQLEILHEDLHNNGKDNQQIDQCHLCQAWVHPECVGEDYKDIIGICSCASCRMLPTLVERLLEKTSQFESLFVKLERSNQQLVSMLSE